MYLGPAHRKSRYRQLMARVGRGDDIIGQFSTLLSGRKRRENVMYSGKINTHNPVSSLLTKGQIQVKSSAFITPFLFLLT